MAEDHSGTGLSQLMSDTQTQLPWNHLEIWYKQMTHFVEEAWGAPWPCCSAHLPPSTWKSRIAPLFPLAEVNIISAKVGERHLSYWNIWALSDMEIFEMFDVLFLRSYLQLIEVLCSSSVAVAPLLFSHEWVFELIVSDLLAEGMYLTENMENKVTVWTMTILVVKKSSLSSILKLNLLFFSPLCLNWFISLKRNLHFGYSINQGINIWRRLALLQRAYHPWLKGSYLGWGRDVQEQPPHLLLPFEVPACAVICADDCSP